MNWKIQLSELNYDEQEADSVLKVITSEWLTMGKLSYEFEECFQNYIGHQHRGVFVSSATAGLHLILMALGIKAGDEVILPALTFVSDANVVIQLGAKPVFCDSVSVGDFNACEKSIIEQISDRTKAIIIVHFAGYPMNLERLTEIAQKKNIPIIEDCAHAPGARINGVSCGNMADASFFSFFSNKNLAIGEGGMVFCKDHALLDKVRSMRSHGMSTPTLDRHEGRAFSYDVENFGLNYRADEIRAALGLEQLKKLDAGNRIRNDLFKRYQSKLSKSDVLIPFNEQKDNQVSACHIMPVILPINCNRLKIMQGMRDAGIQTSIHYPSFASFSAYSDYVETSNVPVALDICNRELTLPLHPRMTTSSVDFVVKKLIENV